MKKTFVILFSLLIVACCVNSAFSQTAPVKIAVIDSNAFDDEKTGIIKYVNAYKQIDIEIQPRTAELKTMLTRAQTLEKEARDMEAAYQKNPNGPIGPAQIQPKVDEIEKIRREGTYKQEDLNKYIQKRRQQLLGPIVKDISDALLQYAKQKGYTLIFDLAKDQTGFLITFDNKIEVTKDFIAFYNARPAIAPSTTTPPKTN